MDKDTTLRDISYKLVKTDEELATALTKLFPLELAYTRRKNDLILNSGMATMLLKEAEASNTLAMEDISDQYLEAKLRVKILYSRRDTFMEISRNLRSMAFEQ